MYKNFNLTESEKEQILNLHKQKGYGKSLNEQAIPNASAPRSFDYNLLRKKFNAFIDANSDLASGRYQSNPKAEAAMIARVKSLEADYEKMRALAPPIPKPTTTKFMPPEIKHDEEVTKPEPPADETPLYEDDL